MRELLKEIYPYLLVIFMVIVIRTFIVTPVRVNGSSMEPTLYDKEILILEKFNRFFNRFDVIVLDYNGEKLVKRIVGLPGEHVKYIDNKLYINNKLVNEGFSLDKTYDFDLRDLNYTYIPSDYYFVMGDNRDNSTDSRKIGLVNKKDILGTVRVIVFPFNKLGIIKE